MKDSGTACAPGFRVERLYPSPTWRWPVKLYSREGMAFVDLGRGYLLCIGTEEEVLKQPAARVYEMIAEAIAVSEYQAIKIGVGKTIH